MKPHFLIGTPDGFCGMPILAFFIAGFRDKPFFCAGWRDLDSQRDAIFAIFCRDCGILSLARCGMGSCLNGMTIFGFYPFYEYENHQKERTT